MTNSILSALVNGTIVGVVLAGAVRAGLLLVPRRMLSAAARYAVWWTAIVAVLLLPLAYLPATHTDVVSHRAAPVEQAAPTSPPAPAARVELIPVRRSASGIHVRFPLVLTVGGWSRWIPIAWAFISGSMLLRLLASCILLQKRKSEAVAAPAALISRIGTTVAKHGCTRRFAVLRSSQTGAPMLAGLWRPAILIPERLFAELTEEELTQIGLHETAHLARRDDYALLASRIIEALLPVHPAVRWIVRQIDLERELACDDFVLENVELPRSYAACLLRVVELCSDARATRVAAGMATDRSQLTRRVDRMLDRNRETEMRTGKARLLTAVGVVIALACLAGRTPRAIALAIPQVAIPQAAIQPPQTKSQSHIPEPVLVPVTVTDLAHRDVSGLTKESFRILEDGVEQQISDLVIDDPPLSVEILVDASGSMRNQRPLVDAAVMALMRSANPADEFLVVNFNTRVDIVGPFGNEPGQIQAHLDQARGGTALRDALVRAAEWKSARYPDRMLVVISDGIDNASSVRNDEVHAAAFAAVAPVWAITLASPADYPKRESLWLQDLAESTSGHEFVSDDPVEVSGVAASIANRTRYVLKYISANQTLDGKRRTIKVDVVTAPPGALKVRARQYYYANSR